MPLLASIQVGGNKLNSANVIVWPAILSPSTVTVKLFDASAAEVAGESWTATWVQFVAVSDALTDAKTVESVEETSEMVAVAFVAVESL